MFHFHATYQKFIFSNIVRRRNLLRQFRIWKIRKRKLWAIVVTERAKKEMADQEKSNSRK
jgi:hypothetical protein